MNDDIPTKDDRERLQPVIYVSGPYSRGHWGGNIQRAINKAEALRRRGFAPIVPHTMTSLWSIMYPHDKNTWLEVDKQLVLRSDGILRIDGKSEGTKVEVKTAQQADIPVFGTVKQVEKYFTDT